MRTAIAIALVLLVNSAQAAQIYSRPGIGFVTGATSIYIHGQIDPGDEKTFNAIAEQISNGQAVVVLSHSHGGDVLAAMNIGHTIQKKQFATMLRKRTGDYCESACTLILLAGARVTVEKGVLLGFHRPSVNGQENGFGDLLVMVYLGKIAGLNDKQIDYMMSAAPNDIHYAMPRDSWLLGFDPQVIVCPSRFCNWQSCQKRWCYITP
jgi:membrane-bound ClpP family serine protease